MAATLGPLPTTPIDGGVEHWTHARADAPARYPESLLTQRSDRAFTMDDFSFSKEPLGRGKFGVVYKVREKASRKLVVLKVIEKRAVLEEDVISQLRREVEVHCRLIHPNIIRMYAYFHDVDRAYIVLEHANGGTLYERLSRLPDKRLPEAIAASYVRQLCEALRFIHGKHVIHRDIKPENILLHTPVKGGPEILKLCDFGWSVAQRVESRRITLCGTVEYLPPEVVDGAEYGFGFDMWCVGVLMYEMLVGYSPFIDPALPPEEVAADQDGIFSRIRACEMRVPKFVSRDAAALLQSLLILDGSARLSAEQVLQHAWVQAYTTSAE